MKNGSRASRFFFHVALNGELFHDKDGCSYFDLASAKAYGRRLARDLSGRNTFKGAHVMMVDQHDEVVLRISVDELAALKPPRPQEPRLGKRI